MHKNTVKPTLTGIRAARAEIARRTVENDEFAAFTRRIIRAYGRRIAAGDIEALADMVALSEDLDRAIADAVAGLRSHRKRYSWQEIATRLGITRQAAHQRWGGDTRGEPGPDA